MASLIPRLPPRALAKINFLRLFSRVHVGGGLGTRLDNGSIWEVGINWTTDVNAPLSLRNTPPNNASRRRGLVAVVNHL